MAEFEITDVGAVRVFRVQSWDGGASLSTALVAVVGAPWPRRVGAVAEGWGRVLCIGPTDWVVVAPAAEADSLHERLKAQAGPCALSVVDVSEALPAVRLRGSDVREVLAQGSGVDVHPRVLTAGQCVRTRFAQVPVILHCTADGATFDCYVSRSYRAHLETWFAGAST